MLLNHKVQLCIGIFTVKKVYLYNNKYYTYGGFGDYLKGISARFEKVILAARVKEREPGKGFYEIDTINIEIVHLPQPNNELKNLVQLPAIFLKALKHVKRMDIVHNRMPDYTGIMGAIACKIYRKPYFVQVIADWAIEAQKITQSKKSLLGYFLKYDYLFYDRLERWACKKKLVFAQGDSCFEKHKNHSICHLVASTAHYDSDVVKNVPVKFKNPVKKILTAGRLTGIKNQALLIRAIAALKQEHECWQLHILGFGPLEQKLKDLANELNVSDNIFFHGQIERGSALWNFFDEADVFILSSRSEGTPKVLLEAMARGLPVIASNVGGIPAITAKEERALLFEDNNMQDLLSKIKMMESDESLRNNLTVSALKYAASQTVDVSTDFMIAELEKTFPSLFNKK